MKRERAVFGNAMNVLPHSEDSTEVTILIGDKSYPQTIPIFEWERGTMKLRFGRAKLDGISRFDELDDPAASIAHRMLMKGSGRGALRARSPMVISPV